jgi:hypothetical protein
MSDITIGHESPAHMTAEEDFRSLPKWAEHVSCGEMANGVYLSERLLRISSATDDITRLSHKG